MVAFGLRSIGLLIVLPILGLFVASETQAAGRRLALVIGNSAYRSVQPLRNPARDVRLIAEKLRAVEFEVDAIEDADLNEMRSRIRTFADKVAQSGNDTVALLFYAGHGVQDDKNRNYLIPVDAALKRQADLVDGAIRLEYIQELLEDARPKFTFVILDACRDNPLPVRGGGRGLAPVDSRGRNTFIAFSTAPGQVADDGDPNGNSPYASALAAELTLPATSVDETFRKAHLRVVTATNGRQSPWKLNNVVDEFTFVPPAAAPPPESAPGAPIGGPVPRIVPIPVPSTSTDDGDPDIEYQKAVLSDTIEEYERFLRRFPKHARREIVVKLLERKREEILWREIEQEPNAARQLALLDRLISGFPDGAYIDRAKRRRADLIDRLTPPAPVVAQAPLPVYVPAPQPQPPSIVYGMVAQWAVSYGSNCAVARQSYWFSTDGNVIRWRNGGGNIDVERIVAVSAQSFSTQTIGSPTVPGGTNWTYYLANRSYVSVARNGRPAFNLVRCG